MTTRAGQGRGQGAGTVIGEQEYGIDYMNYMQRVDLGKLKYVDCWNI